VNEAGTYTPPIAPGRTNATAACKHTLQPWSLLRAAPFRIRSQTHTQTSIQVYTECLPYLVVRVSSAGTLGIMLVSSSMCVGRGLRYCDTVGRVYRETVLR